ncbi:glycosyltransferase family 4 protein [Calothrix membranacea FACHB-236]|nr:glycosyltransferase family 4 protein [Calothrix membranacea FACHB-236]
MQSKKNIFIVATHPIQYQIPWFQALAKQTAINWQILYISIPDAQEQGVGFGVAFDWDIPLLEGYNWRVAEDVKYNPNRHSFWTRWIQNPINLLRQLQPDVVILTGWHSWTLLQLLWACKRLGIPCIVRGESNNLKPRPFWVQWIHSQFLQLYDAFLVIGHANAQFYKCSGVEERKLFICPYFVDNLRFAEAARTLRPNRNELRKLWNIPQEAVCFCYVGKLEPKKRILDLLTALQQLIKLPVKKTIHLLVVGTGELMESARTFVETYQLPVTFSGFLNQSEIARAYVAADCLVLPSDYGETWGLVVNEAMACSLPAVVSDRVGCGLDLVEPGKTGEIFPFADTHALTEILDHLAANPTLLKDMGEQAYDRVTAQYSIQQAVQGTLAAVSFV